MRRTTLPTLPRWPSRQQSGHPSLPISSSLVSLLAGSLPWPSSVPGPPGLLIDAPCMHSPGCWSWDSPLSLSGGAQSHRRGLSSSLAPWVLVQPSGTSCSPRASWVHREGPALLVDCIRPLSHLGARVSRPPGLLPVPLQMVPDGGSAMLPMLPTPVAEDPLAGSAVSSASPHARGTRGTRRPIQPTWGTGGAASVRDGGPPVPCAGQHWGCRGDMPPASGGAWRGPVFLSSWASTDTQAPQVGGVGGLVGVFTPSGLRGCQGTLIRNRTQPLPLSWQRKTSLQSLAVRQ